MGRQFIFFVLIALSSLKNWLLLLREFSQRLRTVHIVSIGTPLSGGTVSKHMSHFTRSVLHSLTNATACRLFNNLKLNSDILNSFPDRRIPKD